jgi:hypothetical protein
MHIVAPILALVGLLWYIVAAWREGHRFLALSAVLLAGIGVAIALGKLAGDHLRYASYAAGLCSLMLLCGAIFHWRKLLLPWLLIIAANVLVVVYGAEAPWMKGMTPSKRTPAGHHERH